VLSRDSKYQTEYKPDKQFPNPYFFILSLDMQEKVLNWAHDNPIKSASQTTMADYSFFGKSNDLFISMENGAVFYPGDIKSAKDTKKKGKNNLISSLRLYEVGCILKKNRAYNKVNFDYIAVLWKHYDNEKVEITKVFVRDLFKEDPRSFRFNFTAGLQIQESPKDWVQDFKGTRQEWWKLYNEYFIDEYRTDICKGALRFAKRFGKKEGRKLREQLENELKDL